MHHLVNFKNFADVEINLLQPVTLLIGRNGASKSNVIEGVELLANLAQGRSIHQISDVGRGSGTTFEIRGGLLNCPRKVHDSENSVPNHLSKRQSFTLGFSASVSGQSMDYRIEVAVGGSSPQPHIASERLEWGARVLFETVPVPDRPSADILSVRYDNFARGGKKPTQQMTADQSVLSRYETFATSDNQTAKDAKQAVEIVRRHLQNAYVFDPNPKLMRGYENMGQTQLLRDGSNLAPVSYEIHRKAQSATPGSSGGLSPLNALARGRAFQEAKEALQRIQDRIRQLPEDAFTALDFEKTSLGEVGLRFKYSNQSTLSAKQMSDGTLRALAILTALETVPRQSRIVVEEIDNGIHPARVKTLVDAVWETAKRRNLNVLATTHNPATLDQLSDEQIQGVVLCFHDVEQKASRLLPITQLPAAESLLEQGRLGELMTRQVLEQHVQPNFESQRAQQGLDWLAKLKQAQTGEQA